MLNTLIQNDLKHIWHPCSVLKDFSTYPPLVVERAQGHLIYTNQGPLIDAISSWWCKSLGHGHPAVMSAIKAQLESFEHVIHANTTHPNAVALAEKLADISQLQHVYFASDGSSAVEIALKMALQAQQLKQQSQRQLFLTLPNSYHGETFATLSVSDLGAYKEAFSAFQLPCHVLSTIPYVHSPTDPGWKNSEAAWQLILPELEAIQSQLCAVILEPIVQGAGGMRCYSADFLQRLVAWAKQQGIYCIADEIMTGIGRTGKWLACEHADVQPDFICLSKGLTSGTIPLSCVLIDHAIYDLFYQAPRQQAFLHSHTYGGHALGVSAALATLKTIEQEGILQQVQALEQWLRQALTEVATQSGRLTAIRSMGGLVAADLEDNGDPQCHLRIAQKACELGVLLRPMGKTLYWLPPLNIDKTTVDALAEKTWRAIEMVYTKTW